MLEIIVADIGGTHARFAIANITDGKIRSLDNIVKMKSAEHASLQIAWEAYAKEIGRQLPRDGSIAVAGPVGGDVLNFTNSSWMLRPKLVPEKLELDRFTLINDFGAVGHAVSRMDDKQYTHLCGPNDPLRKDGIISVIGPGTGLGVAHVHLKNGCVHVTETEGGHINFAPADTLEDRLLEHLRKSHRRVSVERVVSGPGLQVIYSILAGLEKRPAKNLDNKELWQLALSGKDSLAAAALDRFCLCLGGAAGDIALAQGAKSVVIAGGLGARLSGILASSGFKERFAAKGRFQWMMEAMPVKQLLHEEPGLFGAAAAFLNEHEK